METLLGYLYTPLLALQVPDKTIQVNIGNSGHAWYHSPIWIAIGILAVVVVLLLIVVAVRGGGGTTIVKD
jgi:hypothetical protein